MLRLLHTKKIKYTFWGNSVKKYNSRSHAIDTVKTLFFDGYKLYKDNNGRITDLSHFEDHGRAFYYFSCALTIAKENNLSELETLLQKTIISLEKQTKIAKEQIVNMTTTTFKSTVYSPEAFNALIEIENFFNSTMQYQKT